MKRLLIILVFFSNITKAQDCGTPPIDSIDTVRQPYFGNNQLLLNIIDTVESLGCKNCKAGLLQTYQVPVQAWVYNSTTANGIDNATVERYIRRVNQYYADNRVNIFLYLKCEVKRQTNNTYFNGLDDKNYKQMFDNNWDANTLNIHFVFSTTDNFNRGRFPWKPKPYTCYVSTFGGFVETSANTLVHEIGHTFGLCHTHENARGTASNNAKADKCYQESVSRTRTQGVGCVSTIGKKKCEVNGDMLCDTDADPQLFNTNNNPNFRYSRVDVNCNFAPPDTDVDYLRDNWGQNWLPLSNNNALRNIMSYSTSNCRTQFTPMQRGVMYNWVVYGSQSQFPPLNNSFFFNNLNLDIYENDNYWRDGNLTANAFRMQNNQIAINTRQYHTFHWTPTSTGNYQSCDTDWVWFDVSNATLHTIKTSIVPNQIATDTEIVLYSVSGGGTLTEIARNDNISGSDSFSRIDRTLSIGSYAIQVINKSPYPNVNSKGNYYLEVGCTEQSNATITGANFVCNSNSNFSLTNAPAGTSVTWSVSSNLQITGGQNTTAISVRAINSSVSGTGTITATLTSLCGTAPISPKTVSVGSHPGTGDIGSITYGTINNNWQYSQGVMENFEVFTTFPATTYLWEVYGGDILSGQGTASSSIRMWSGIGTEPLYGYVRLTLGNECGQGQPITAYFTVLGEGGGPLVVLVNPNPSGDFLEATIEENPDSENAAGQSTSENMNSPSAEDAEFYELQMLNAYGQSVYRIKTRERQIRMDVRALNVGLYYLQLIHSKGICKKTVMIAR